MSTLKKGMEHLWAPESPEGGRLSKSHSCFVIMNPMAGRFAKSQAATANTVDQIAIRVSGVVQRAWPNGHIAEVSGFLYGTGIYDPINVSFVSIEVGTSSSGPWTVLTPDTSDPLHVFPSQADEAGAPFCLVVEPDVWIVTGLWFKLTVNFSGLGNQNDKGGAFVWNGNVLPGFPGWVSVPVSSLGPFTVSWAEVGGASGYEISEGVQTGMSIAWGSYVDVGDVTDTLISGKPAGTYWYKVRAYNPADNRGSPTTSSNGCEVIAPGLKVTPDLGWPDRESMFDTDLNSRAILFPMVQLIPTTDPVYARKTRDTLVFQVGADRYKLPAGSMSQLGTGRHLWRYEGEITTEVESFELVRSQRLTSGSSMSSLPSSSPSILR